MREEPNGEVFLSPRFSSAGFSNVHVSVADGQVTLRTTVKDREEFKKWLEVYCELSCCTLNSYRLLRSGPECFNAFGQVLVCHHNGKHKGVQITHTK